MICSSTICYPSAARESRISSCANFGGSIWASMTMQGALCEQEWCAMYRCSAFLCKVYGEMGVQ